MNPSNQISSGSCREFSCLVIMPSGSGTEYKGREREALFVYEKFITDVIHSVEASLSALRCDHRKVRIIPECANLINTTGNITDRIIEKLKTSDIVIADLTGSNPNVYFELGIRYSLKPFGTITIARKGTTLPFDVSDQATVFYSLEPWDHQDGREELISTLFDLVEKLAIRDPNRFDNLVYRVLHHLERRTTWRIAPNREVNQRASCIRDTWSFRSGKIGIVASSVDTKKVVNNKNRYLVQHFRRATGSGQFYALEWLLPPLSLAYADREIRLLLANPLAREMTLRDVSMDDKEDLVFLGGDTNPATRHIFKVFQDFLPFRYDVARPRSTPSRSLKPDDFSSVTRKRDGRTWQVKPEGPIITEDFGILVWTQLPIREDSPRDDVSLLIAFGGTTYGTEAAVKLLVEASGITYDIRGLPERASTAYAIRTTVKDDRCGEPKEEPEHLGTWIMPTYPHSHEGRPTYEG